MYHPQISNSDKIAPDGPPNFIHAIHRCSLFESATGIESQSYVNLSAIKSNPSYYFCPVLFSLQASIPSPAINLLFFLLVTNRWKWEASNRKVYISRSNKSQRGKYRFCMSSCMLKRIIYVNVDDNLHRMVPNSDGITSWKLVSVSW